MKRKVFDDLMKRKKQSNKKPLIIKGARQVGNNVYYQGVCESGI